VKADEIKTFTSHENHSLQEGVRRKENQIAQIVLRRPQ
jgi:hypothetical protein